MIWNFGSSIYHLFHNRCPLDFAIIDFGWRIYIIKLKSLTKNSCKYCKNHWFFDLECSQNSRKKLVVECIILLTKYKVFHSDLTTYWFSVIEMSNITPNSLVFCILTRQKSLLLTNNVSNIFQLKFNVGYEWCCHLHC